MTQTDTTQFQRLLKASDVAQRLNISRALAYRLIQREDIPVIRINHAVRVKPEDLEAYISKCRVGELEE